MYTCIHLHNVNQLPVFHLEVGVASAMIVQVTPCTYVLFICVLEYFCFLYFPNN